MGEQNGNMGCTTPVIHRRLQWAAKSITRNTLKDAGNLEQEVLICDDP